MKLTEEELNKVSQVVVRLNNGYLSLEEYAPIMIFANDNDEKKVQKGLSILKNKIDAIRESEDHKELKKHVKVKKILKGDAK